MYTAIGRTIGLSYSCLIVVQLSDIAVCRNLAVGKVLETKTTFFLKRQGTKRERR
jgi:hypothetical protein